MFLLISNISIKKNQFNNYLYTIFIYFIIFLLYFLIIFYIFLYILYKKIYKIKQSFIIALRKLIKKARKSLTFLQSRI